MRLWTLHPKYLDRMGILGLWREALLARAVLRQGLRGYSRHPQLERFKAGASPIYLIDTYLKHVRDEMLNRTYSPMVIEDLLVTEERIPVTAGQVIFEIEHLNGKLVERGGQPIQDTDIALHPIFYKTPGSIESWEKVKK